MKDCIVLEGMEFFGRHGVMAEENVLGQRFIIDLSMYFDLRAAGASDDLNDTVNYGKVYSTVQRIVQGEPVKLLENLADRIFAAVFAEYPMIEDLRVVVHKPGAPIDGVFNDVKIKMKRQRSEYIKE